MIYGYVDYMAVATMPDSRVTAILNKWCQLFNIARKPAQYAEIKVQVKATETLNIPAGTKWRYEGSQLYYVLEDSVSVQQKEEEFTAILVLKSELIGNIGNRNQHDVLTVQTTIPNLTPDAIVEKVTKTGADEESDISLRNRLVARLRRPPQGGCPYDYIAWALALPGVSRAWVLPRPNQERGKVWLTYLKEDGIPSTNEADEVQIQILKVCPLTADLAVKPPTEVRLNIRLEIFPEKDPDQDEDQVLDEIKKAVSTLLKYKAVPKGYFNATDIKTPESGIIYKSDLHQAISSSSLETRHKITFMEGNEPDEIGQIVVIGEVTRAV
jgi:uncharacterized phage protein gp47/JayE